MHVQYTLSLCQNVAFMSIISYILYIFSDISEMNQLILFVLINQYRGLMHIIHTYVSQFCSNTLLLESLTDLSDL